MITSINEWRKINEGARVELVCDDCDGDGYNNFSCCGDDMKNSPYSDIELCPTCKEHTGGEEDNEDCDTCDGAGVRMVDSDLLAAFKAAEELFWKSGKEIGFNVEATKNLRIAMLAAQKAMDDDATPVTK